MAVFDSHLSQSTTFELPISKIFLPTHIISNIFLSITYLNTRFPFSAADITSFSKSQFILPVMNGRIDALQNLTFERRPWRIQVRALRMWMQPNYSKDSAFGDCLEMVVVDRMASIYLSLSFLCSYIHCLCSILPLHIHGN